MKMGYVLQNPISQEFLNGRHEYVYVPVDILVFWSVADVHSYLSEQNLDCAIRTLDDLISGEICGLTRRIDQLEKPAIVKWLERIHALHGYLIQGTFK